MRAERFADSPLFCDLQPCTYGRCDTAQHIFLCAPLHCTATAPLRQPSMKHQAGVGQVRSFELRDRFLRTGHSQGDGDEVYRKRTGRRAPPREVYDFHRDPLFPDDCHE